MVKNFMIFGVLGWCAEILWTGFCSFLLGDAALTAQTYLWMFPIYGLAGLSLPLFLAFRRYCPLWQRVGVYVFAIFAVEFITGWLLQWGTGICPWDYTVEVRNRFKGLDLIDRVSDELWMEFRDIIQETGIKTIPKKKKCKKAKWLSEEAL